MDSLVDKYTMRSKAYKNFKNYFLQTCLYLSVNKFNKFCQEKNIYKFVFSILKEKSLLNKTIIRQ